MRLEASCMFNMESSFTCTHTNISLGVQIITSVYRRRIQDSKKLRKYIKFMQTVKQLDPDLT